ncbi:MAG: hypothetical protein ABW318_03775, partial [Vicinamibacterales bacterium]
MRWYNVLAYALLTGQPASVAGAQTPVLYGFDGSAAFAVRGSVEGAEARLGNATCQEVFEEFSDRTNRPLLTVLTSKGMSALDAFGLLRFVEARDTPQCRAGSTLAFTQPGAPMIRICSSGRGLRRIAVPRRSRQAKNG